MPAYAVLAITGTCYQMPTHVKRVLQVAYARIHVVACRGVPFAPFWAVSVIAMM